MIDLAAPEHQIDGRWLFKRMQKPVIPLTGQEERARFENFQAESYLVPGASTAECYLFCIEQFK